MKFLLRAAAHRYGNWMFRREDELCSRATDRIVRPFELGLEWTQNWPCTREFSLNGSAPIDYVIQLNEKIIESSREFFAYEPPKSFDLKDDWLSFASPITTPYAENNTVRGMWYPARGGGHKAVVVLPHWNAKLPQHNALCAGLQRLGISALRLSLPYHDARTPAGMQRADYAMSANICRTIDATRQAVIDTRACFDWLEQRGFTSLGIVGTSIGSCYAFLASALDSRIRVNMFNHCSTYVADVVWEGLSTRHIRDGVEGDVDLETLRQLWRCISPPVYYDLFTQQKKRSKFIYTRYDTTFPLQLSRDVIAGAKRHGWDHDVTVLPCGHYTMGEFPFKYVTGYEICSFLKRNL
jgi:dienelactone hydrolase